MFNLGAFFGIKSELSPRRTDQKRKPKTLDLSSLDITYINDRVVAMGYPSERFGAKESSLNKIDDLTNFLRDHHQGHFLVWNINEGRSDQSQHGKKLYDRLAGQILNIPWDSWDNEEMNIETRSRCPTPPLSLLVRLCYSIIGWLNLNPNNVAFIMCREEHRSTILAACFLRFSNECMSTSEAYARVLDTRQKIATSKGNTSSLRKASQAMDPPPMTSSLKMLFTNFDIYMVNKQAPEPSAISLVSLSIESLPVDSMPTIDIWNKSELVYSSTIESENEIMWSGEEGFFYHKIGQKLCGDFVIIVRFGVEGNQNEDEFNDNRILFKYTNCAGFIKPGAPLNIDKSQLDVSPNYISGFEDMFCMTIITNIIDGPSVQKDQQYFSEGLEPLLKGSHATRQGLLDIASFHNRVANMKKLDRLLSMGFPSEAATLSLQLTGNDVNSAVILIEEGLSVKLDTKSDLSPMNVVDLETAASPNSSPLLALRKGHSAQIRGSIIRDEKSNQSERTSKSSRGFGHSSFNHVVEENEAQQRGSIWDQLEKCVKCAKDDSLLETQLLECMICSRKFHTVCVDLPEIPIKSIESPKDQSNLEAYIEENFSDWRCEDCSSSNDDEVVCINRKERYTTVSEGSEDGDEGGISPQTLPMTSSKGTEGQSEFFPEPIESENMPSSSKSENFPKRFNTVDLNCNQSKADTKCNSPCGDKKCSDGKRFQSPRARSGSNTEFVTEKLENSLRKSLNNTDSYNQSILEVAKILKKDGIEGELEAINRASVLTRRTSSVEKERASRAKSMIPLDSANVGNNSTFPNNSFMTPIRERSRKDVVGSDSESIYSEKNRQSIQELTNIIKSQGIESRAREASMSSCEHSPNESRRSSNVEEKILKHTGSTINTLFGSKGKVCEEIKRNSFDKNRLMSFDGKGSIQNGSFSTSNAEMIHTPHPNALNTASSKNSQLEKGIMPQPKEINEILNDSTESSDDMHQDDETQRKLHRKDAVPDMHALAQKYSSDFVSKDNLDTINEDANPINLDTKKPSDSFVGMHAARNDPHPESKKNSIK